MNSARASSSLRTPVVSPPTQHNTSPRAATAEIGVSRGASNNHATLPVSPGTKKSQRAQRRAASADAVTRLSRKGPSPPESSPVTPAVHPSLLNDPSSPPSSTAIHSAWPSRKRSSSVSSFMTRASRPKSVPNPALTHNTNNNTIITAPSKRSRASTRTGMASRATSRSTPSQHPQRRSKSIGPSVPRTALRRAHSAAKTAWTPVENITVSSLLPSSSLQVPQSAVNPPISPPVDRPLSPSASGPLKELASQGIVPQSLIPQRFHVYEPDIIPPEQSERGPPVREGDVESSTYDPSQHQVTGSVSLLTRRLFPSKYAPGDRAQAVYLRDAVAQMNTELETQRESQRSPTSGEIPPDTMVDCLLDEYSLVHTGLVEVGRQVMASCVERGKTLFNLIDQSRSVYDRLKLVIKDVQKQALLETERAEATKDLCQERVHNVQMRTADRENKFTDCINHMERVLQSQEEEINRMKTLLLERRNITETNEASAGKIAHSAYKIAQLQAQVEVARAEKSSAEAELVSVKNSLELAQDDLASTRKLLAVIERNQLPRRGVRPRSSEPVDGLEDPSEPMFANQDVQVARVGLLTNLIRLTGLLQGQDLPESVIYDPIRRWELEHQILKSEEEKLRSKLAVGDAELWRSEHHPAIARIVNPLWAATPPTSNVEQRPVKSLSWTCRIIHTVLSQRRSDMFTADNHPAVISVPFPEYCFEVLLRTCLSKPYAGLQLYDLFVALKAHRKDSPWVELFASLYDESLPIAAANFTIAILNALDDLSITGVLFPASPATLVPDYVDLNTAKAVLKYLFPTHQPVVFAALLHRLAQLKTNIPDAERLTDEDAGSVGSKVDFSEFILLTIQHWKDDRKSVLGSLAHSWSVATANTANTADMDLWTSWMRDQFPELPELFVARFFRTAIAAQEAESTSLTMVRTASSFGIVPEAPVPGLNSGQAIGLKWTTVVDHVLYWMDLSRSSPSALALPGHTMELGSDEVHTLMSNLRAAYDSGFEQLMDNIMDSLDSLRNKPISRAFKSAITKANDVLVGELDGESNPYRSLAAMRELIRVLMAAQEVCQSSLGEYPIEYVEEEIALQRMVLEKREIYGIARIRAAQDRPDTTRRRNMAVSAAALVLIQRTFKRLLNKIRARKQNQVTQNWYRHSSVASMPSVGRARAESLMKKMYGNSPAMPSPGSSRVSSPAMSPRMTIGAEAGTRESSSAIAVLSPVVLDESDNGAGLDQTLSAVTTPPSSPPVQKDMQQKTLTTSSSGSALSGAAASSSGDPGAEPMAPPPPDPSLATPSDSPAKSS